MQFCHVLLVLFRNLQMPVLFQSRHPSFQELLHGWLSEGIGRRVVLNKMPVKPRVTKICYSVISFDGLTHHGVGSNDGRGVAGNSIAA